jgi:hypothetical protein
MAPLIKTCIEMAGSWIDHSDRRYLRWEGTITADQPITALRLMKVNSRVEWARYNRTGLNSLPIGFLIGKHDEGTTVSFDGLQRWVRLDVNLDDIQIEREGETGKPLWLIEFASEPTISLGCFVVAHSQTNSARNKLWHLRQEVLAEEEAWTAALSRGRTGGIAL